MLPNQSFSQPNPLASFMRQPKIYIRLPSGGNYWPEGSLAITENNEYAVYSMTAKDELMLKIPDAVMNGQAVVDVIQHCVPGIKNAWEIPSIDLDAILIAIRIATYGEFMKTPLTLGEDLEMEYSVDLRIVLENIMQQINWEPMIPVNPDLTVFVKPLNYKQISESAVKTFETQKIIQMANDSNLTEEQKLSAFKDSFGKLTEVTIGLVQSSIYKIDSTGGRTDNPWHIKEFVENVDKDIFNVIQKHTEDLRIRNEIKPIKVAVTDEMREKGVKESFIEIPLVFDPATFFA